MFKRAFAVFLTLAIILAIGWFAMQRDDIALSALEQRYSYADSQHIHFPDHDVNLHYRDLGPRDAPPVLLIHGFSSSGHTWDSMVNTLAQTHRVLVIDLPGHGLTRGPQDASAVNISFYADLVDAYLTALDLNNVTLIGHSMGGHVSWAFALDHPEHVSGLVLIGAAGVPASEEEQAQQPLIFRMMRSKFIADKMLHFDMTYFIRGGLLSSYHDDALVTPALVERYVNLSRGEGHRAILMAMQNAPRGAYDFADLATLDTPTSIIHGAQDTVIPLRQAQALNNAIPNATLKVFDQVGHMPQEEVTADVLAIVTAFLAALPTPEPTAPTQPTVEDLPETIE